MPIYRLVVPVHDPDQVDRLIRRILDAPAYDSLRPNLLERVRDRVLRAIADLLASLSGTATGTVVAWVLVLAGVAVTAVVVWRLLRTTTPEARVAVPVEVAEDRSAAAWRVEATRAEARGDWRPAVLYRFRALLADLVEDGLLDAQPGRTVGAYRAQVAARRPAAVPPFGRASDLFEAVWYGDQPVGPDEPGMIEAAAREIAGQGVAA